ncbi:hypothetical protein Q8F55_003248 [Vanrija albida]|uniref:Uncharacterized protein n=1 Tax=Vanrija albida TaxID=181172 RepID=A0ABR3QCL0_9TREE
MPKNPSTWCKLKAQASLLTDANEYKIPRSIRKVQYQRMFHHLHTIRDVLKPLAPEYRAALVYRVKDFCLSPDMAHIVATGSEGEYQVLARIIAEYTAQQTWVTKFPGYASLSSSRSSWD